MTVLYEEYPMERPEKLSLTGRWKVAYVRGRQDLYLEVRYFLFFTRWVDSDYIHEYPDEYSHTNKC